ncbi:hypothetical protein [Natronorubrum sp. FCH18a]|uniref:hypothetical protein n=1 Tax=Natronorubrum sp. FCH18a TaxID=3447018 RepID=UPI003F50ED60
MTEEVPVTRTDLLVLVAVSLTGGFLIALWTVSLELSPQFVNAVFVGAVMLAFFLFIPVMGARLFIDDWKQDE